MDIRDRLLGRIQTGSAVWNESPDDKESNRLRDKARAFLDKQGQLTDNELKRMVALLFTERVGGF